MNYVLSLALNLHHSNFTWQPLALILKECWVDDLYSPFPLSHLIKYICVIPSHTCTFFFSLIKLFSYSYRVISTTVIILTTSMLSPFCYISSDTGQPEPQKAFIMHLNWCNWCSWYLHNEGLAAEDLQCKIQREERNGTSSSLWKAAMLEQSQSSSNITKT